MNVIINLTVCTLIFCACTVHAYAQQGKSQRAGVTPKTSQSTEPDEPFCPPKEADSSFCTTRNSRSREARCTALMKAAERGQLNRVRALLASGVQVDARVAGHITALAIAAIAGHLEVVKALLAAGANPNLLGGTFHGGPTMTWMAALNRCNKNWLAIFDAMLTAGVELNPKFGVYMSPLGVAIHKEDEVMIRELLKKGADVNLTDPETGETPLMFAAKYSSEQVVTVLLDGGAEINARDKSGKTALSLASANLDAQAIIALLKQRGAKE